jgi:hypothetical protein
MGRLFLILLLMSVILAGNVFSKEWNGLVPCRSTRREAEALLGRDSMPHADRLGSYWYEKAKVYIDYIRTDESDSQKDIVQVITVYPRKSPRLAKYTKMMSNFPEAFVKTEFDKKTSHINYLAHYFNVSEGFHLTVQKDDDDVEIITGFGYYGILSDCSKWSSYKR